MSPASGQPGRRPQVVAGTDARDHAASQRQDETASDAIPDWTEPDDKGLPRFTDVGSDTIKLLPKEIRRHVYRQGDKPVRIKVKTTAGWTNFYRVRRPSDGAIGWQAKKPAGYRLVPYISPAAEGDPFDPRFADEVLFWSEGEKDTDTLAAKGSMAFTFGGSGDVPAAGNQWVRSATS